MDREKLEKASDDFAHSIPDIGGGGDYTIWHVMDAFEQGADWLMQQSISERLTEEEKDKIKAIYFRSVYSVADVQSNFTEKCLIDALFGADLFK